MSISFISSPYRSFNPSEYFILPRCIVNNLYLSVPNFILTSWENMCIVYIKEFSSLSFYLYSFMLFINNRWLIFMLRFSRWYPHSISQSIIDNGIRALTETIGERVSSRKIPLLTFTSSNTWLFTVKIFFQLSVLSNRNFSTPSYNCTSSTASFTHKCGTIS